MAGVTGAHLTFQWKANSFEIGETATIEVNDGTWHTVQTVIDGQDDNAYHSANIDLSGYNMVSNFQIRVAAHMSATNDYFYIDNLIITGTTAPPQRTLTVSSTAGGTVTTPGIGTYTYPAGTDANIVATANTGYHFAKWTGTAVTAGKVANPNAATTTVLMDANYTVQANFAINQYTITASAGPNGTISPSGTIIKDYNSSQLFTATPATGYDVNEWKVDGGVVDGKYRAYEDIPNLSPLISYIFQ